MMDFKLWIEEQQSTYARRKNYFDQVMKTLQATEDDLSTSLDQLPAVKTPHPEDGESQPPQKNQGAVGKVASLLGNLLQQMSNDKIDTDISVRSNRTMDMLRKRSNDGVVQPKLFLQDILRELFGNDFHEEFLTNRQKSDNTPVPPPDDNAEMSQKQSQMSDLNPQMTPPDHMNTPQNPPFGGNQFV